MDLYIELNDLKEYLKEYRELLKQLYPEYPLSSKYQNMPNPFAAFEGKEGRKRNELRDTLNKNREALVEKASHLSTKITHTVGKDTLVIHEFGKPRTINVWDMGLRIEYDYRTAEALNACIDYTLQAIGKLKTEGESWETLKGRKRATAKPKVKSEQPRVFIAHGGKTAARDKLCRFMNSLGITPLIIEEEPKEGRSVNQQVEHYLEQADCAIVFGTADDKELKDGKLYPRRDVYIEIGRFQQKFPNKIIYLLEAGASLPSNISEKLYTRFTQENMEEAFVTVARELKAFGLI